MGAAHVLVKNYVNEGGFKEWENDPRFPPIRAAAATMTISHLEARAATQVQKSGLSFSAFGSDASQSRILTGYVRAWLKELVLGIEQRRHRMLGR
jgi:hypothetical protein